MHVAQAQLMEDQKSLATKIRHQEMILEFYFFPFVVKAFMRGQIFINASGEVNSLIHRLPNMFKLGDENINKPPKLWNF